MTRVGAYPLRVTFEPPGALVMAIFAHFDLL